MTMMRPRHPNDKKYMAAILHMASLVQIEISLAALFLPLAVPGLQCIASLEHILATFIVRGF
jgi:hypothetical protein